MPIMYRISAMLPLQALLLTTFCWFALATEFKNCPGMKNCECKNTVSGWVIDCTKHPKENPCNLRDVPYISNITEAAMSLNLSKCDSLNIAHTDAPFMHYSNLKILDLHKTNLILTSQSVSLFEGLENLEYLDISGNDQFPMTAETPVEIFKNLTSLRDLRIHGTTGTYRYRYTNFSYPEELLTSLPNLQKLSMDATNITFGPGFRNMTKLEFLRISGDMIDPPWRSLEFCEIGNICGEMVANLIHVKHLSIIKCAVKSINEIAFKNMTNLKIIDFSSNTGLSVESFAKAAKNLHKGIDSIILDNIEDPYHMQCGLRITKKMANNLRDLNVKSLSLQHNAINSAEDDVFQLLPRSLEHLTISRNEFELGFYIFHTFHMTNLKTIDLSYNFFTDDYGLWRRNDKGYFGGYTIENVMDTDVSPIMANIANETDVVPETEHLRREKREQTDIPGTDDNYYPIYTVNDLDADDGTINYNFGVTELSYYNFQGHHITPNTDRCPKSPFDIPPGTITAYLPPNMESLNISYSKLGFPIYQFFFDKNNSLTELKASSSLLFCWEGPVHGVEKLKRVDLSLNDCSYVSQNFFTKFPELEYLNVSRNLLNEPTARSVNGELFRNNKKLQTLDMSFNHIQSVPEKFLINQNRLEWLSLSDNGLSEFTLQIKHMQHLVLVNLRGNHMNDICEKIRNEFIVVSEAGWRSDMSNDRLLLDLRGNRLECSCNTIDFMRWVSDNYIDGNGWLGIIVSTCKRGANSDANSNITSGNEVEIIVQQLEKECASYTPIYVGAIVVFVILLNVIVGVTVHRFRWKIRYWYYVSGSKKRSQKRNGYTSIESDETRFRYDVYVASINDNICFVVETLKKKLESESYRVFLQDYDIPPGQNMCSFIANGIHVSRVALFVVSDGCESDPDFHIAIRMAQEESTKRAHRMYLGLVLNLNEIKFWSEDMRMLSRTCGLDFPENRGDQAATAFWADFMEKLKDVDSRQSYSYSINSVA